MHKLTLSASKVPLKNFECCIFFRLLSQSENVTFETKYMQIKPFKAFLYSICDYGQPLKKKQNKKNTKKAPKNKKDSSSRYIRCELKLQHGRSWVAPLPVKVEQHPARKSSQQPLRLHLAVSAYERVKWTARRSESDGKRRRHAQDNRMHSRVRSFIQTNWAHIQNEMVGVTGSE